MGPEAFPETEKFYREIEKAQKRNSKKPAEVQEEFRNSSSQGCAHAAQTVRT